MLAALAFVPPNNVIPYYEELCDNIRNTFNEDCDDVIEYFEDNYIGRFRRNDPRRAPTFSIDLWNMFHRTFDELPRTNNSVEGWHRSFQATVDACHSCSNQYLAVHSSDSNRKLKKYWRIFFLLTFSPPPVKLI